MKNINFNEDKHEYIVNGKKVPCVSDIMQVASCLYYTNDIPKFVLELACRKGSAVHKAIEDYWLFEDYELEEQYKPIMNQFLKWYDEYKPEVLYVEHKMANDEYAGTCDLIAKIKNKTVGIDYKTSSELHDKMIAIQMAGYNELAENEDIRINEWYALHLTKNKYEFKKIEIKKEIWDKCKDIYFYMKGEKNE